MDASVEFGVLETLFNCLKMVILYIVESSRRNFIGLLRPISLELAAIFKATLGQDWHHLYHVSISARRI